MFADRIKELRKAKGLTQIQFAREFNVANGTVGMWETGKREPDFETTQRIADFFGVTVDELLGRGGKKEEPAALEGSELKNAVIFSRDGKVVKKTYSAEKWKTIVEMLDAIPEDDKPL